MAVQAAMIADTIVGMKKALKREADHSGPDDSITQPTNRGNKLKVDAKYVHEGALGYTKPQEHYKEKVEHAGYSRYILRRNPPRYDSEGDELDDDDVDEEADAAAAEENPFSDVVLEKLLCPLKHPSDLADHPSMAHAYTSQALEKLVEAVKSKLQQERTLLWRAKNLHSQFLGDCTWMPCGAVESPDDHFIFEPRRLANSYSQSNSSFQPGSTKNTGNDKTITSAPSEKSYGDSQNGGPPAEDVEMTDAPAQAQDDVVEEAQDDKAHEPKMEDSNSGSHNVPQQERRSGSAPAADINATKLDASSRKQSSQSEQALMEKTLQSARQNKDNASEGDPERIKDDQNDQQETSQDKDKNENGDEEQHSANGSSPEPPRRMTTRAQTNQTTLNTGPSSRAPSPSHTADSSSSFLNPHPLFLLQSYSRPDRNFGLPPNEADETRRLLWSYVQKQEETVRSFTRLLDSLLKAYRMKEEVWEWCKVEGHVGEMSDGEDWYDRERWGLAEGEELKKGIHEPDDDGPDEGRATGKRGRGRRQ